MGSEKEERQRHVPNDIILDILARLSLKSQVRFKCVCKTWCSFISQQLIKCDDRPNKLILQSRCRIHSVDFEATNIEAEVLNFPLGERPIQLVGSCNGLLCILLEERVKKETVMLVWNPLTGMHKSVGVSLLENNFGFGYDPSTDDYKIVILRQGYDWDTLFEIYSLNTNIWERGKVRWNFFCGRTREETGTFVNGALYWRLYGLHCFGGAPAVLRFDLIRSNFSVIQLPYDVTEKPQQPGFDRLIPIPDNMPVPRLFNRDFELCDLGGGRLGIVQYHFLIGYDRLGHIDLHFRGDRLGDIDLWEWKDGEEQKWIKFMTIPRLRGLDTIYYLEPALFLKSGEVLLHVKVKWWGKASSINWKMGKDQFHLYSPEEKKLRPFKIEGIAGFLFPKQKSYFESLVSPIRHKPSSQMKTRYTSDVHDVDVITT